MSPLRLVCLTAALLLSVTTPASSVLLDLLHYESEPGQPMRREAIAILDIDSESHDFGKISMEIPLPADLVDRRQTALRLL